MVDLYGWAGPCQAAVPRFQEMHFACQDESVLQFLQVRCTAVTVCAHDNSSALQMDAPQLTTAGEGRGL